MSEPASKKIGRYEVRSELGRGAMGVVYRAEDPLLGRKVAIKTILLSGDPAEREDYEARFLQEARAAGGLNHPNIVTIHDVGREGEMVYMAMELVEGVELREMIPALRQSISLALELAMQIAEGLAFAHAGGVVHRDIKPANVMVVRARQAKIMDFGIARLQESLVKTQAGMVLGSPQYMSPEQITGQAVDGRSDIFSLGSMLYEMATGEAPFRGADMPALSYMVCMLEPTPASQLNPALPPMLELILNRALAKDREQRYQNASEMAADLSLCRAQLEVAGAPASPAAAPAAPPASAPSQSGLKWQSTLQAQKTLLSTAALASTPTVMAPAATDSLTALHLSRHFNAEAALKRLAKGSAALPRRRRNLEPLALAAVLALALAGAIAIVFV